MECNIKYFIHKSYEHDIVLSLAESLDDSNIIDMVDYKDRKLYYDQIKTFSISQWKFKIISNQNSPPWYAYSKIFQMQLLMQ